MMIYPQIDPVAFKLGAIQVHWYGLMYLLGFVAAWLLANYRMHNPQNPNFILTRTQISDLIFYAALGVIIGGRIGYMIFYSFSELIAHPLSLFKIWGGGMSFHGGLLGVIFSLMIFAKRSHKNYFDVMDFLAPLVPVGLGAGRIGNFINGELWGRVTTAPWGMVFPNGGLLPRHPSQLYEFFLEGVMLFTFLWFYSAKPRPRFAVSGMFLLAYGIARFICELFRQPDWQIGYLFANWLTMGQLLCLPMIVGGILILFWSKCSAQQRCFANKY